MDITILGAGHIGGTLGQKWASAGHEILYGVRDPESKRASVKFDDDTVGITFATVGEAVEKGDVVLLAVPGAAAADLIREHGAAFGNKIVIDATNNLQAEKAHAFEAIVEAAPNAVLFRAFNTLGWENFAQPIFDGLPADMFYCGADEPEAQAVVENLIKDVGLRPVRVGGLDQVDVVDGVLHLWITLAHRQGLGRHLAFKMLIGAGA
jgi:predicted dinucleotide-binding enzyme